MRGFGPTFKDKDMPARVLWRYHVICLVAYSNYSLVTLYGQSIRRIYNSINSLIYKPKSVCMLYKLTCLRPSGLVFQYALISCAGFGCSDVGQTSLRDAEDADRLQQLSITGRCHPVTTGLLSTGSTS